MKMTKIYLLNNLKYEGVENLEVFKIDYIKSDINLSNYDALIFTSKNAIYSLDSFNKKWKDIPGVPNEFSQSHVGTRVLAPHDSITPLKYRGEMARHIQELDKFVSIALCYCSIYDECWKTSRENMPVSVDSCEIDDELRFEQ